MLVGDPRVPWRRQMRRMGAVLVAGAVASLSLVPVWNSRAVAQTSLTTGSRNDSPAALTAVSPKIKDENFDLTTIVKSIVDVASRLKSDGVEWGQKFQELVLDLKNNPQDVDANAKDIDECLIVLQAAADRIAPESENRRALQKIEAATRNLAARAEVHADTEIRKTASYLQQKTSELHALNRSVEEMRIRLFTQIDRLKQLKAQLGFNHAAAQNSEAVKGSQVIVDNIQAIAAEAQRLASDLDGFGRTPAAAAKPTDPAKPTEASRPRMPAR
jgi:hypothetical protein